MTRGPAPVLRGPTRWERLVWRLLRRWPESYVGARLDWLAAMDRYYAALGYEETIEAMREQMRDLRLSR